MPSQDRKNELLYRVYFVLFVFILLAVLIGYRVFVISVLERDEWRAKKDRNYMVWRPMKTERGQILADDGKSILASSVEFFDIRMDPVAPSDKDFYANIDGLAAGLATVVGKYSPHEWKGKIVSARVSYIKKQSGGNRNLLIADDIDHFKMKKLSELPLFEKGQYKGGIIKLRKYRRQRPFKDLAARTIGIDRDSFRVGLEHYYNTLLQGEQKKTYMKRVAPDLYIPVFDPTEFEIIRGNDIVTTIDIGLQDVMHNELLRGLKESGGQAATAVIMEVSTGKIKAISNLSKNANGVIGEFKNFAIAHSSEPGSTMKAATVLALLEDNAYKPSSVVDFSMGKKNFYGHLMHDSGNNGITEGELRVALEKSSNVGIASAADEFYNKTKNWSQFASRLNQFGMYSPTDVDIQGEPQPQVKDPVKDKKNWYNTTIPWMAHGYEVQYTPLQILNFYNTVANDGYRMRPYLVSEIKKGEKVLKKIKPSRSKEPIAQKQNIEALQAMLEGVVERGSATNLKSRAYTFAGKTGTAKLGYNGGEIQYNASFVGYWPSSNPKYSMIVVIYGLNGSKYYGNVVAGPVFKRIMDWVQALEPTEYAIKNTKDIPGKFKGKYYGQEGDYAQIFNTLEIPFKSVGSWVKGYSSDFGEVLNSKALISTNTVPDVQGMGPRDAIYVLENIGMKVKVDGYGKVIRQSIRPGNEITKNEITLYLN